MASFGVFEDGELIAEEFVDEASAEEHVARLKELPLPAPGTFDVRQICPRGEPYVRRDSVLPDHGEHGVDDCTGEGPWADGPDVLERIRTALLH